LGRGAYILHYSTYIPTISTYQIHLTLYHLHFLLYQPMYYTVPVHTFPTILTYIIHFTKYICYHIKRHLAFYNVHSLPYQLIMHSYHINLPHTSYIIPHTFLTISTYVLYCIIRYHKHFLPNQPAILILYIPTI
jgi:hypothetical protein